MAPDLWNYYFDKHDGTSVSVGFSSFKVLFKSNELGWFLRTSYIQKMKELKDELGQGISNGEFGEQDIVNLNKIDDYFYAYQVSLFPLKEDKSEEFQNKCSI